VLSKAMSNMNKIYAAGTVGDADRCLYLEGANEDGESLKDIMANSVDYNERLWAWLGWRTNVGDALRQDFETYVELKNKWAQVNGFEDYGHYWAGRDDSHFISIFCFRELKSRYLVTGLKKLSSNTI
jgi:angiotensin-converting enzyme 2